MSLGRGARVIRGLWPDRNPLRRAHDRVEAVVVGVLFVAFLAGAPWAIVTAGRLAYTVGSRTVPAPSRAKAGSTIMVWVDGTDRPAGRPMQRSQVWFLTIVATVLTIVLIGLIVLCAGRLTRYALDRRRLAAWDVDWRATEPQWTGRR